MDHKWIRCKTPDDVLVIKRTLFEVCGQQSIRLPCEHPHLIVVADDLNEITFETKQKIREMLDGPRRTPNPA